MCAEWLRCVIRWVIVNALMAFGLVLRGWHLGMECQALPGAFDFRIRNTERIVFQSNHLLSSTVRPFRG